MRRDVFQAIADPSRRMMIEMLVNKKATVSEIAENFDVSLVAVSKQLKILSECGLVRITQVGRERYCEATPEKLSEVSEWVASYEIFWKTRLKHLKDLVENKDDKKEK